MDEALPADRNFEIYPLYQQALGLFVRHLPLFVGLYLPITIATSVCLHLGAPTIAHPNLERGQPLVIPPNEWLAFAGALLISLSFGLWAAAAIYRAADEALAGGTVPGFAGAYSQAVERVPALFATQLLYLVAVMIGMLFCVVPGIWLAVLLVASLPRAATRDAGPISALRDAHALVSGRWWRVAGYCLLVGVTIYAGYAPYVFLNLALPFGDAGALVRAAANILAGALIIPFQFCAYTALHRRLEETG